MTTYFSTWLLALPTGAIIGWIASKLFAPTMDALGAALLNRLSLLMNKKRVAYAAYQQLKGFVRANHHTNGHNRFNEQKTYRRDPQITAFFVEHGSFMCRAIKSAWIEQSSIDNYDQSDVFFAGMDLFFPQLSKKDIQKIYEKYRGNNQAALFPFLEVVEERKPKLLSTDVLAYLRAEQKKWDKLHAEEKR